MLSEVHRSVNYIQFGARGMNPEEVHVNLLATQYSLNFDKHRNHLAHCLLFTFVSIKTLAKIGSKNEACIFLILLNVHLYYGVPYDKMHPMTLTWGPPGGILLYMQPSETWKYVRDRVVRAN